MAHALAAFIRERMDAKGWQQRDLVRKSGLSRALVSKYVTDDRETLRVIPERATLEGFAKAFGVPTSFMLGKAIEALGAGYSSGDFVNDVERASDADLLAEVGRRLARASGTQELPRPIRPDIVWERSDDDEEAAAALEEPHDPLDESEATQRST